MAGLELTLGHYLAVSAALFTIGVFGIFVNRKNIIVILMSIELILLSVNINLVAFSVFNGTIMGQVFAMLVLTVAAAEAAVGLAILVVYFRTAVKSRWKTSTCCAVKGEQGRDLPGNRGHLHRACARYCRGGGRPWPALPWRQGRHGDHDDTRRLGLRPCGLSVLQPGVRSPRRGRGACAHRRAGALDGCRQLHRELGDQARYAFDHHAVRRDERLGARAHLLHRLHGRRSAPRAVLRLSLSVHLRHADAGDGGQLHPALLRLGRRRPRVLPAHRFLVQEAVRQ